MTLSLPSVTHSHAHLPGHPPARPTHPDVLCEVVIEPQARHSLIRHLYFNAKSGTVFGQRRGCAVHVQVFLDSRSWLTTPSDLDVQPNWQGQWCVLADHNRREISPPPCAGGLVLTASWNQGTLDIQARTAQGEALSVQILA